MACGSVVVFVGARVLSLDDEATTIALVVCLGVAFTVGVATTAWLSDQAAAEARRAQDEALDAFMDSIVEDAVENAIEAAPECEDGAEWSASLDDGFVWARY